MISINFTEFLFNTNSYLIRFILTIEPTLRNVSGEFYKNPGGFNVCKN